MPLDRETTPHYWLTVCAQDHGLVPKRSCVQAFVAVEDENDMVPWPERAQYDTSVREHCAAGTHVVTVRAHDPDLNTTLTYRIVAGNPDGLFSIDERTGETASLSHCSNVPMLASYDTYPTLVDRRRGDDGPRGGPRGRGDVIARSPRVRRNVV